MSAQPDARKTCKSPAESYFRAGQERLSQRALAQQLRGREHRFPNEQLRQIAEGTGLIPAGVA